MGNIYICRWTRFYMPWIYKIWEYIFKQSFYQKRRRLLKKKRWITDRSIRTCHSLRAKEVTGHWNTSDSRKCLGNDLYSGSWQHGKKTIRLINIKNRFMGVKERTSARNKKLWNITKTPANNNGLRRCYSGKELQVQSGREISSKP